MIFKFCLILIFLATWADAAPATVGQPLGTGANKPNIRTIITLKPSGVVTQPQQPRPAQRQNYWNTQSEGPSRYDWNDSDVSTGGYNWGYQWTDEFGNQMFREESSDGQGTVWGRYSYREATGILRIVEYISDEYGYRTKIRSNEPGIITSYPAGAEILRFEDENNIPAFA